MSQDKNYIDIYGIHPPAPFYRHCSSYNAFYIKLPLYLRWQFSLNNSLDVGDNILGGLRGAVEVGDVALRNAFGLLLHSILLLLLVEVPLEAPLAWIKSKKQNLFCRSDQKSNNAYNPNKKCIA